MFDRLKSKTAVATAASLIAALGVGGVAVAQNSGSSTASSTPHVRSSEMPGQESQAPDNRATDQDNVQAGDQSGSDKVTTDSSSSDQETNDSSDSERSASEQSGSDGPGDHADQGADHEASGQE